MVKSTARTPKYAEVSSVNSCLVVWVGDLGFLSTGIDGIARSRHLAGFKANRHVAESPNMPRPSHWHMELYTNAVYNPIGSFQFADMHGCCSKILYANMEPGRFCRRLPCLCWRLFVVCELPCSILRTQQIYRQVSFWRICSIGYHGRSMNVAAFFQAKSCLVPVTPGNVPWISMLVWSLRDLAYAPFCATQIFFFFSAYLISHANENPFFIKDLRSCIQPMG